jgi:hypothetical protein
VISMKIPMIFTDIERSTLKLIWKHKTPWIAREILSKKSNAGLITIPDSKLYYKALAIKTVWYLHKKRYEDQWNQTDNLGTNSYNYPHFIFDKCAKNIWWRKDSLLNKYCWGKLLSISKKLKLDPCLSPGSSRNSKWIENFNIRPETLMLEQEGAGNTL